MQHYETADNWRTELFSRLWLAEEQMSKAEKGNHTRDQG